MVKKYNEFIKFLGTAGARFVMIKQLRSSAGIWISVYGKNIILDPGPGSIVRCALSRPRLDPSKIDAIILTHRHLDHSGDINVMIEAMTEGGFKKRGVVFLPSDAIDKDPIILAYLKDFPEKIEILKALSRYKIDHFEFQTSMRHLHPVETYGIKFKIKDKEIGFLTDTKYFKELNKFYKNLDILVVNIVFYQSHPEVEHLSLEDVEDIIQETKPQKAILTHFGMSMLKEKPHLLAEMLSKKLNTEVLCAYDGMCIDFG
ncbi:MAG: MBL fold metallo-hydrolase [Candidatus Omnitrophica bacterium]|nr:MBL fold metallo-hydrolase [Candidatus Omnitrophota bacterium]